MNLKYLILALTIGLVLIYKSGSAEAINHSSEETQQQPAPSSSDSQPEALPPLPAKRAQQPIEAESLADLVEELSNFFEEIIPERSGELSLPVQQVNHDSEPLIRAKRADEGDQDEDFEAEDDADLRVGDDDDNDKEVQEEPGRFRRLMNKIMESDLISRDMLISIFAYLVTTILLLLIGPIAGPNAVLIVQAIKQGVPILLSYLLGEQESAAGGAASEGADVAFDTLPEMSLKLKPVQAAAKSLYKMIF